MSYGNYPAGLQPTSSWFSNNLLSGNQYPYMERTAPTIEQSGMQGPPQQVSPTNKKKKSWFPWGRRNKQEGETDSMSGESNLSYSPNLQAQQAAVPVAALAAPTVPVPVSSGVTQVQDQPYVMRQQTITQQQQQSMPMQTGGMGSQYANAIHVPGGVIYEQRAGQANQIFNNGALPQHVTDYINQQLHVQPVRVSGASMQPMAQSTVVPATQMQGTMIPMSMQSNAVPVQNISQNQMQFSQNSQPSLAPSMMTQPTGYDPYQFNMSPSNSSSKDNKSAASSPKSSGVSPKSGASPKLNAQAQAALNSTVPNAALTPFPNGLASTQPKFTDGSKKHLSAGDGMLPSLPQPKVTGGAGLGAGTSTFSGHRDFQKLHSHSHSASKGTTHKLHDSYDSQAASLQTTQPVACVPDSSSFQPVQSSFQSTQPTVARDEQIVCVPESKAAPTTYSKPAVIQTGPTLWSGKLTGTLVPATFETAAPMMYSSTSVQFVRSGVDESIAFDRSTFEQLSSYVHYMRQIRRAVKSLNQAHRRYMSSKTNFYKMLSLPHSILFQQRPEIPPSVSDSLATITATRRAMWTVGEQLITGPFMGLYKNYVVPCIRLRSRILELEARGSDMHGVKARELERCQREFMTVWRELQLQQHKICNNNFNDFLNRWVLNTEQCLWTVKQGLHNRSQNASYLPASNQMKTFIPVDANAQPSSVVTDDGLPAFDNDTALKKKTAQLGTSSSFGTTFPSSSMPRRTYTSSSFIEPSNEFDHGYYGEGAGDLMRISAGVFNDSDWNGRFAAKQWTPGTLCNESVVAYWMSPADFVRTSSSASSSSCCDQSTAFSASSAPRQMYHGHRSDFATASTLTNDYGGSTSHPDATALAREPYIDPALQRSSATVEGQHISDSYHKAAPIRHLHRTQKQTF